MSDKPILADGKDQVRVRQIFMNIKQRIINALGSMAFQNKDAVDITGGAIDGVTIDNATIDTVTIDNATIDSSTIEGSDVDVTGQTLSLDNKQIDTAKIGTTVIDTDKMLAPDGSGGVEFVDAVLVTHTLYNDDLTPMFDDDSNPLYA